jgi:hypothetical protein
MRVKYHDRLPGKYADWYRREARRWAPIARVEDAGSQWLLGGKDFLQAKLAVAEYGGKGDQPR